MAKNIKILLLIAGVMILVIAIYYRLKNTPSIITPRLNLSDSFAKEISCDDLPVLTIEQKNTTLPTFEKAKFVIIEVSELTTDIDFSGLTAGELCDNATVRIRKIDDLEYTIKYTDSSNNLEYKFLSKKGEIMSLKHIKGKFYIV